MALLRCKILFTVNRNGMGVPLCGFTDNLDALALDKLKVVATIYYQQVLMVSITLESVTQCLIFFQVFFYRMAMIAADMYFKTILFAVSPDYC